MALNVTLDGSLGWKFDGLAFRETLIAEGEQIATLAKVLVSRPGTSSPGGFPGRKSGRLHDTVDSKIMPSGLAVVITHKIPTGMDQYPFMLARGIKRNNRGARIEQRADYIDAAFRVRRGLATTALQRKVEAAFKPTDIT